VNTCGTIGSSVVGAARALLAAMTLGHMHAPIARIPVSSLSIQVFMGPGSCRWTYILDLCTCHASMDLAYSHPDTQIEPVAAEIEPDQGVHVRSLIFKDAYA